MARKFKFVSPGIFLREIDDSRLPRTPEAVGPVVVGRTRKGPSLVPVKVDSFAEFVELFGTPVPGGNTDGDVWRNGNVSSPTYAAFAAQAWLANNGPLTVVRLAGAEHQDAGAAGQAGWKTTNTPNSSSLENGGAYGLFVWNDGLTHASGTLTGDNPAGRADNTAVSGGQHVQFLGTGTLAAVWYLQEGAITLSGNLYSTSSVEHVTTPQTSACGALIKSRVDDTTGGEWKVQVRNVSGTVIDTQTFTFQRDSSDFVRKVFNTSPVVASSRGDYIDATSAKTYWLGETYESTVLRLTSLGASQKAVGTILALKNATADGSVFTDGVTRAETGWFIGQDLGAATGSYSPFNQQKLFKFKALPAGGDWDQQNIKVSITDLVYSNNEEADPYGSFTLLIRDAKDTDAEPNILEAFTGVNLNPNSPNFIARKVGDKDMVWDDVKRVYRTLGNYDNLSNYVTIEMNTDVENGNTKAALLPFGFYGPPRYKSATLVTNATGTTAAGYNPSKLTFITAGSQSIPFAEHSASYTGSNPPTPWIWDAQWAGCGLNDTPPANRTFGSASALPLKFPSLEGFLRQSASAGRRLGDIKDAYFGIQTDIAQGGSDLFDKEYLDLVRRKPTSVSTFGTTAGTTETSFIFTLDNVVGTGSFSNLRDAIYTSGSRVLGTSITAVSASNGGYKELIDAGVDRFTSPMFGGTQGVDITEMDPFNNVLLEGGTETTSYEYNSIKRAIDSVADAERVEMNLMALPGVETPSLTQHMINVCEGRGDSLAIIDIENGYTPRAESNASLANRVGDVTQAINSVKTRKINSSYGCAYYPWVQIVDSENDARLWVPPSIAALGTFASSERSTALWFAPAGFNRGGLTQGSAGINVNAVDGQLTSKDRDNLYAVNVNPIASFPAEGIVIFGQKTLQATPSALDRINVRRLLIYVKREISTIAATTLFEPNIDVTWGNFSSRAVAFLDSVKVGGGLTDFRVVLDESTTTPDLVDRNIMYAQVLLKPARAIEFIAVDFVIKRTGASFDD